MLTSSLKSLNFDVYKANMPDGKTTASGRIGSDTFEDVIGLLEDENIGDPTTQLIRATFKQFKEDKLYREFMIRLIKEEVNSLREYTEEIIDIYEIHESLRNEVISGLGEIIAGVQNNSYNQAIRGGERLSMLDRELAKDVTEYLAGIDEFYWNDKP